MQRLATIQRTTEEGQGERFSLLDAESGTPLPDAPAGWISEDGARRWAAKNGYKIRPDAKKTVDTQATDAI